MVGHGGAWGSEEPQGASSSKTRFRRSQVESKGFVERTGVDGVHMGARSISTEESIESHAYKLIMLVHCML